MVYTVKEDDLNIFFTKVINVLLQQAGLDELEPNELTDIIFNSTYQGTNRPKSTVIVEGNKRMISFTFEKGNLTTSKWRYFKY